MQPLSSREIAALARWLETQDDFVFLDNARPGGEEYQSLLFLNPRRWLFCRHQDEVADFFAEAAEMQRQGYVLAGWIGYEFGYLLEPSLHKLSGGSGPPFAVLGVFSEPLLFDHRRDNEALLAGLMGRPDPAPPETVQANDIRPSIDRAEYLRAINRIKEYIVAGDTYQVNYTLKLNFSCHGRVSSFYTGLRRNQAVAYGAWIRQGGRDIMSFSPELFFSS